MKTLIANINHAIRNKESVTIGGGTFTPDELNAFVNRVLQLEEAVDLSLDYLESIMGSDYEDSATIKRIESLYQGEA